MMNKLLAAAFCLLFASFAFAQNDEINIIPKPQSIQRGEGRFILSKETRIVIFKTVDRPIALMLRDILKTNLGLDLKIVSDPSPKFNNIFVSTSDDVVLMKGDDDYTAEVEKNSIHLYGPNSTGLFYAIQTFRQLLPVIATGQISIPVVKIEDRNRFNYRGMHLDVSRHFFPVEFVKKYIDLMSQYKFNKFHWHLTDDQGWRIEIKKYPKLTEIGSKRPESVKGRVLQPYVGDGVPVEGFYTQEQIKDVIAYAKARYITVIPEIELPGHASAALAAYPQLGCKADYTYKVQTTWGIFKEVFCPTDETFKFLEDVLDETIALFPDSPYIHIGGDEVLKDHWKESPFVQELMKRENLKDEHEVQSYFIRRIEKFTSTQRAKRSSAGTKFSRAASPRTRP
jgi:hexosaminidase